MIIFGPLILFSIQLLFLLLDAAVFFLMIRLLVRLFPVRPLQIIDSIGNVGVEIVTGFVVHHTKRWIKKPLSPWQEEALTLALICAVKMLLALLIRGG